MTNAALDRDIDHYIKGIAPAGDPLLFGRFHKDQLTSRGFGMEARAYLKNLVLPTRSGPKFLIFGRARSGTTLLCQLLSQVPDIQCQLEMLHYKVSAPRFYLNQLARRRTRPIYGCKVLSYQIAMVQGIKKPIKFMKNLEDDGFKFIHIVRNTFDQCLSLAIAQSTGKYFNKTKETANTRGRALHYIDVEKFMKKLRWNEALLDMEMDIAVNVHYHEVIYETDLMNSQMHQATIDRLADFVGARRHSVEAPMTKLLPKDFDSIVANADDVRQAIAAAGLSRVLHESSGDGRRMRAQA